MTISSGTSHIKRLALVRTDNLGDFLMWLSAAACYRRHFHNAEISLFASEMLSDLAEAVPYWDKFVPLRLLECRPPTLSARNAKLSDFDLVVNLQYSRSLVADRFVSRLAAPCRSAIDAPSPNMSLEELASENQLYTTLLRLSPKPLHELERNFEIFNAISGAAERPHLEALGKFAARCSVPLPDRFVALFPGSSWKKRNYPWPRFVQLCETLHSRFGLVTVLCGSQSDADISGNIHANAPQATLNLNGKLKIRETFDVISRSSLVVANDSMAGHAANLLGIPSVCIIGGGYNQVFGSDQMPEGRFFPYPDHLVSPNQQIILNYDMECYGCSNHCKYDILVRDTFPCIDYVSVGRVIAAAEQLLLSAA